MKSNLIILVLATILSFDISNTVASPSLSAGLDVVAGTVGGTVSVAGGVVAEVGGVIEAVGDAIVDVVGGIGDDGDTDTDSGRPCPLNDYECIGQYMEDRSDCQLPQDGSLASQFVIDKFRFHLPFLNATFEDNKLCVKNFNLCHVSEFRVDLEEDVAILGIDCPNKIQESQRSQYLHRRKSTDKVTEFHFTEKYSVIQMTVLFPSADPIELADANVLVYVPEPPELHFHPEKPIFNRVKHDASLLSVYAVENMYNRGTPMARHFIQNLLCDYGLEIAPGIPSLP